MTPWPFPSKLTSEDRGRAEALRAGWNLAKVLPQLRLQAALEEGIAYDVEVLESGEKLVLAGESTIHLKLGGKDVKATLADYIRLVQLQKELEDWQKRAYVSSTFFAWVHLGLGQTNEAISRLQEPVAKTTKSALCIPLSVCT